MKYKKRTADAQRSFFMSNGSKFEILEFQPVPYVHTEGKQRNCDLRNDTGVLITNVGIVAANVNDCANHGILL